MSLNRRSLLAAPAALLIPAAAQAVSTSSGHRSLLAQREALLPAFIAAERRFHETLPRFGGPDYLAAAEAHDDLYDRIRALDIEILSRPPGNLDDLSVIAQVALEWEVAHTGEGQGARSLMTAIAALGAREAGK